MESQPSTSQAGAGPAPGARVIRVVVVDDHEFVRRGLRTLFAAESDLRLLAEVAEADDVRKIIRRLRPDVVVLDASAQDGNALALIGAIRRVDLTVRVIALSMTDKPEHIRALRAAGATEFVFKLDPGDRLLEKVRHPTERAVAPPAGEASEKAGARRDSTTVPTTAPLNPIERRIAHSIASGMSTQAIAASLNLTTRNVAAGYRRIRRKLALRTGVDLVLRCVQARRQLCGNAE